MLVGVDTGFFYCLKNGDLLAKKVWSEHEVAVSVITIFELEKASLKTTPQLWTKLLGEIKESCLLVPVALEMSQQAARIAHGTNIPSLDSLILASLLTAGCKEIYTSDPHLLLYKKTGVRINLLKENRGGL